MITQFKIFESKKFNIGDRVILNDTFNINKTCWHNLFGIIIDKNRITKEYPRVLYLVRILEYDNEFIEYNIHQDNIESLNNTDIKESDCWVCGDYLIKYDTYEKFKNAIDKIKMTKKINKYNL